MEGDLNLQEIFKLVPIPQKKAPRKKAIMTKHKEGEKTSKAHVDDSLF